MRAGGCDSGRDGDRLRALRLLAGSPDGITDLTLVAQGVSIEIMVDLIRSGLVSTSIDRAGRRPGPVEIVRLRITDRGRQAIA